MAAAGQDRSGSPLYRADDFPVLHERAPYDLVVYQVGNAACHRYEWPYLLRWPGLVVLHDAAPHHARAQVLLGDKRADDYRAEFRFNHPGIDPRVADFVVAGLEGSPYYLWPMLRMVMSRARAVVVHGDAARETPSPKSSRTRQSRVVSMGVPDPWRNGERRTQNAERTTGFGTSGLGVESPLPPDPWRTVIPNAGNAKADLSAVARSAEVQGPRPKAEVMLSAFGVITPEKRILLLLRAVAAIRAEAPQCGCGWSAKSVSTTPCGRTSPRPAPGISSR